VTASPTGGSRRPAAECGSGTDGGAGTLYVVATPIGNLADITFRAIEVLGSVPLIAAEDTRLTKRLLDRHGLSAKLTSFHARSGPRRMTALLAHLRAGADLALVTDAGTPVVSDPGGELVAAWAAERGRVVPIPGASAVLAAVSASGVTGPRWSFEGFLPRSGRDRRERLAAIAADPRGVVLFEAPGRVGGTLRELAAVCGQGRDGAVCRELTKLHEQIVRGTLGELATAVDDGRIPARGEFVLVVGAGEVAKSMEPADVERALAEVDRLVADGLARGEAARRVAAETGIPRRRLYQVEC
jgi:16S rRNA (cytidine1402-2'-O)-methyltransferase